jgi:hypothetical protein
MLHDKEFGIFVFKFRFIISKHTLAIPDSSRRVIANEFDNSLRHHFKEKYGHLVPFKNFRITISPLTTMWLNNPISPKIALDLTKVKDPIDYIAKRIWIQFKDSIFSVIFRVDYGNLYKKVHSISQLYKDPLEDFKETLSKYSLSQFSYVIIIDLLRKRLELYNHNLDSIPSHIKERIIYQCGFSLY